MSRHDRRSPDRRSPTLDVLSEAARTWADLPAPAPPASRWPSLQRSLEATRRRGPTRALWLGAIAMGGAAVVAVVLTGVQHRHRASAPSRAGAVSFSFAGSQKAEGEALQVGAETSHALFSDGSDVALEANARARVLATTPFGAEVRLDRGRARFVVAHHPRVDWSVDAGPFKVIVHATTFVVDWSPAEGLFAIDLTAGRVSITGPLSGGSGVSLEAGRRLTARADGTFRVSRLDEREGQAPPPTPAAAPASSPLASPYAEAPSALSTRRPAPSGHHQDRGLVPAIGATWSARVASGQFEAVVDEASSLGINRCVDELPVGALVALADAARYSRRTELAKQALVAQRRRFAHSAEARDAAFLLGRLSEDVEHDLPRALTWYEQYLTDERSAGSYGSEALGRKMLVLDHLGQRARAAQAARLYLERFPTGPYAQQAARRAG